MPKKRIYDIYYNQFHALICAKSFDEAREIFKKGKCTIKPCENARFKNSCFSFEAEYGSLPERKAGDKE